MKKFKNKIFIISSRLFSGGVERQVSFLSTILNDRYDLYILVCDGKRIDYDYKGHFIDLGVKTFPYKNLMQKMYSILKFYVLIFFYKLYYRPVYSVSFLDTPNFINILTFFSNNISVIVNIKSSLLQNKFSIFIHRFIYRFAYKIVAVSNACKEDLVANLNFNGKNIYVIYNYFDFRDIQEKSSECLDNNHEDIFRNDIILTIGRLDWDKCQWYIIRSFDIVKQKFPNTKLVILGDGPYRDYLEKVASYSSFKGDIYFLGFQRNPYKYMVRSKVYVHSSPFEGFGNIFIEAMSCSLPIVASDCLSSREILFFEQRNEELSNFTLADCGIHVKQVRWDSVDLHKSYVREERDIANGIIHILSNEDCVKKIIMNQKYKLGPSGIAVGK